METKTMNVHLRDLESVIRSVGKAAVLALFLLQLYATPVHAISFTVRTGVSKKYKRLMRKGYTSMKELEKILPDRLTIQKGEIR